MTASLFSNYQITDTLHQAGSSALYRVSHWREASRFLLRVAKKNPGEKVRPHLEREIEIAASLDCASVLRPCRIETYPDAVALVHPDFDGRTLARAYAPAMGIEAFLNLAQAVTRALESLHAQRFVHRALSPDKILVSSKGDEVRFIGLGFASHAFRGLLTALPQSDLPLAYISPEQTGRVGRILDERSDLYSLGVIFYEMLAGRLPFSATDPVAWAHCHIAREPASLLAFNTEAPAALADVVMKLLAKEPHQRYQSASGLLRDLERCRDTLARTGSAFALGLDDLPPRIVIPEQLFGRERERARLVNAFADVKRTRRPALALVHGPAGMGKSALCLDLQSSVSLEYGTFVCGKFEASMRDVPCSALMMPLRDLVLHMLTESDDALDAWKDEVRWALGDDLPLLAEHISEMAALFSPAPAPALTPFETHTRLARAARKLIALHARTRQPLALYLDDLQWADSWSLDVLRDLLLDEETGPLLAIGSCRSDEVFAEHPLLLLERDLQEKGIPVTTLSLGPLRPNDTRCWVEEMVKMGEDFIAEFARALHETAQGIPLLVQQLVRACEREGVLWIDRDEKRWRWNPDAFERFQRFADSPEFFSRRLLLCSTEAQRFLELMACHEGPLGPSLAARVLGGSGPTSLLGAVQEARDEGLVVQVTPDTEEPMLRFSHERVRQAVWLNMPTDRRREIHLQLARSLASGRDGNEVAARIAFHYEQAEALLQDDEERLAAAHWHFLAGHKAKDATAYELARDFLRTGRALLPTDAWDVQRDFTYELVRDLAECEYLCAHYEEAELLFSELLAHSISDLERARIHNQRVLLFSQKYRFAEAVQAGCEALRVLGMPLLQPGEAVSEVLAKDTSFIGSHLPTALASDFCALPSVRDEATLQSLDVLQNLFVPTYNSDLELNLLTVTRLTSMTLSKGSSPFAPFAFMAHSVSLAMAGNFDQAIALGEAALRLNETLGARSLRSRLYHMFGCWISPWKRPQHMAPNWFARSYLAGTETGDLVFAGCAIMIQVVYDVIHCANLDALETRWKHYPEFLEKVRHARPLWTLRVSQQLVRCLRGETPSPTSLEDAHFSEEAFLRLAKEQNLNLAEGWYWLAKVMLHVLAGEHVSALAICTHAKPRLAEIAPATLMVSELRFFEALALAGTGKRDELRGAWADLQALTVACPENFRSAELILAAELDRLEGRSLEALRKLEEAARFAHQNKQGLRASIAWEIATRLCRHEQLDTMTEAFARKAHEAAAAWGSPLRCHALASETPSLRPATPAVAIEPATEPAPTTLAWNGRADVFDLQSIFKATRALSQEMVLEQVLRRLMSIALENTGAERGVLILLDENGTAQVELEGDISTGHLEAQTRQEILADYDAPMALINYAQHRQEPVLVEDAQRDPLLCRDTYVQRHRSRSMLCLPILRQERLLGHLVLENSLMSGAFTPERFEFLGLVMSQAAISIENARLYSSLQGSEARLRAVFESIPEALLVVDASGEPLFANDAARHILDLRSGGTLRRPLFSPPGILMGGVPIASTERPIARALEGQAVRNEEYLLLDSRTGRDSHLCISASPIRDSRNEILGAVALALDVTELRELDKLKDQFLRVVAHELKTPLGIVQGYTELLERKITARPDLEVLFGSIKEGVGSLSRLVGDLLDVSLLQLGRLQLRREDFNVCALVEATTRQMAVTTQRHTLELRVCGSAHRVNGDAGRIAQVLRNLIQNAIKYTPGGGIITVSCQERSGMIQISVMDPGVGIPVDKQGRLFECFYRAHTDTPHDYGGIGAGLFLSREIVTLHGGTLGFESAEGRGSTFHFTIPRSETMHGG